MAAPASQRVTAKKRQDFLEQLARYGNVTQAARVAGVEKRTLYRQRKTDEAFNLAWSEAEELGANTLEDEARRRAFRGVLKPVYQGGERVGMIRDYSDTLLIFLLKGAKPQKYRDNVQLGGTVGLTGIQQLLEDVRTHGASADAANDVLAGLSAFGATR